MARKLVVEIVGDASSLDRSFKKANKSARDFDTKIGRMSRGTIAASGAFASMGRSIAFASGSFLGAAGLTAAIRSSVTAAIDLEQQISKTNVVFAESGKEVIKWSKTLATSFGLSQREALTTASSFGALFAPVGLVGDVAAEQSKLLTELGADLASFYNTDVASALDALRSGLVGESEPLRKYGVRLSEVRVQQEALIASGKDNVKNLTELEKTHARIAIILQDSTLAQGDFGRTSGTAANQIKTLDANIENLKANVASYTVPVLNAVVGETNRFFQATKNLTDGQKSQIRTTQDLIKYQAELKRLQSLPTNRLPDPFLERGEIERRESVAARKAKEAAKEAAKVAAATRIRVRAAAEAARQEVQDRARLAVDRTVLTATIADDIAALGKLNALLRRRIKGGHDVIANEREQLQVQLQINDLLAQQAEARAARRTARQFRLLGFGPEGQDLVPGVGALKRQLASVNDVLAGSFLDTKKTRSLISHIRKVLSGGMGSVAEEVRERIAQILADLKQQLRQSSVDVTRFQKTARGQFALAGAAGGARGVVITGGVHLHGIRNAEQMERELTKRQRQRARQRRSKR